MARLRYLVPLLFFFASSLHSANSRPDLWDISNGITVTATSGILGGFTAEDMFGANKSREQGSTIFGDGRPEGFTHFVEWQTPDPVTITSFALSAAGDGPALVNEREMAKFILKVKLHAADSFVTIYTYTPTHPYTFVGPDVTLISTSIPAVDAQYFRAEFIQWNAGRGFDGPRITELEGFGPSPVLLDYTFEDLQPAVKEVRDWSIGALNPGSISGGNYPMIANLYADGDLAIDSGVTQVTSPILTNLLATNFVLEAAISSAADSTNGNISLASLKVSGTNYLNLAYDPSGQQLSLNVANKSLNLPVPSGGVHHIAVALSNSVVSLIVDHGLLQTNELVASEPSAFGGVQLVLGSTNNASGLLLERVRLSTSPIGPDAFFDAINYAKNHEIPDNWRAQWFGSGFRTDPRVVAIADPDHDGANNFQEYLAGTNPLDASSAAYPALAQINPADALFTNVVKVRLTTAAQNSTLRYTLDASEPTSDSNAYSDQIAITNASTLRARAFIGRVPISSISTIAYQRVYAVDDGISVAWRRQHFGDGYLTDPRVAAEADPDNDGSTNFQEFIAGTNPLDAASGFRVDVELVPKITWTTVTNRQYRVMRKPSVDSSFSEPVTDFLSFGTTPATVIDTNRPPPKSFYYIETR
jgi:hypothetical protein